MTTERKPFRLFRRGRQPLLGSEPSRARPDAAAPEGLIPTARDFCDHAAAICEQCELPERVRDWKQKCCGMESGVYHAR